MVGGKTDNCTWTIKILKMYIKIKPEIFIFKNFSWLLALSVINYMCMSSEL